MISKKHEEIEAEVRKLQNLLDIQEKKDRKNNIVIRGLKIGEGDVKTKVENFIKKNLEIKTTIKRASRQGHERGMIIAVVEKWEDKAEIMKKKSTLGDNKIHI